MINRRMLAGTCCVGAAIWAVVIALAVPMLTAAAPAPAEAPPPPPYLPGLQLYQLGYQFTWLATGCIAPGLRVTIIDRYSISGGATPIPVVTPDGTGCR